MKSNIKIYLLTAIPFICFILGYGLSNMFIGNKSYTTPNLIGLTIHEAVTQTSPFHINIQLADQKECPGIAPGTILTQKPTAGRLIKSHQSIIVVTSKLPDTALAPKALGLAQSVAQDLCAQQKIKCKLYPIQHQLPANTCIGQTPQQGQPIPDKKLVLYIADNSSNSYIMPTLTNQPLQTVLNFLKLHAITVQIFEKSQKILPPYNENLTVTAQKPSAGSFISLQKNTNIQLEVS